MSILKLIFQLEITVLSSLLILFKLNVKYRVWIYLLHLMLFVKVIIQIHFEYTCVIYFWSYDIAYSENILFCSLVSLNLIHCFLLQFNTGWSFTFLYTTELKNKI